MNMLLAREERREKISQLLKEYSVIVSLKTNVPGKNKNLIECKRVLHVIDKHLIDILPFHRATKIQSDDGNYKLYLLNHVDEIEIKKLTIQLEETHPLGRYIDIDVYTPSGTISRRDLGFQGRNCMICDNDAFICMGKNAHTVDEILNQLRESTKAYFEKTLTDALMFAFKNELDLHPKFGLVTPYSTGSHSDMNYELMNESYQVIIPYLVKMYEIGFVTKDVDAGFKKIRELGLEAEKAMMTQSQGVNTYKGAIFLVGILVYSIGYYHQTFEVDFRETIKFFSRDILKELKDDPNTFGIEAYQKYNVYTIRHEVYYGLPSVIKAYYFLMKFPNLNDKALTMTLIDIISNKNDTVGLKRARSFPMYFDMANKIEKITTYDLEKIEAVTQECIDNNISFGGSADVLIATLLVYDLKKHKLI